MTPQTKIDHLLRENEALQNRLAKLQEEISLISHTGTDNPFRSDDQWNPILTSTTSGIWDWHIPSGKLKNSKSWIQFLELNEEELTNTLEDWENVVYPGDKERVINQLNQHLQGKTPSYQSEYRVVTKSGQIRWILDTGKVIEYSEDRSPIRMLGTIKDITLRKQAELDLNDRTERLNTITQSAPDAILMMDHEGVIIFWNPAATRILGYEEDEVMGKNLHNLLAPQRYHKSHHKAFDLFRQTGKGNAINKTQELYAIHKDGHEIAVELTLAAIAVNHQWNSLGFIRDISTRKETEARLAETQKTIRENAEVITTLFNNIPDLIFFKDPEGHFMGCNPAFEALVDKKREEIIGLTTIELFGQTMGKYLNYLDNLVVTEHQSRHQEVWLTYPNKRKVLFDIMKTPFWSTDGKLLGILGIARDITESKRTEMALRKRDEDLINSQYLAKMGSWEVSFEQNKVSWSKNQYHILGLRPFESTPDKNFFNKIVLPEDLHLLDQAMEKIKKTKSAVTTQLRVRLPDNSVRWFENTAVPVYEEGKMVGLKGTNIDITEKKDTELNLQKQTELQEIIMDVSMRFINIPAGQLDEAIMESLGRIGGYVQAQHSYIYEYDWKEKVAFNTHEWAPTEEAYPFGLPQKIAITDLESWSEEHVAGRSVIIQDVDKQEGIAAPGSVFHHQSIKRLVSIPLMNNTSCLGFVGFEWHHIGHGLTEKELQLLELFTAMVVSVKKRILLVENLIKEKVNAEMANHAKSAFLSNMGHEIRTPLTSILGYSEILKKQDLKDKQKEQVDIIMKSGENLLQLINDILALSKVDAGKMEYTPGAFDLIGTIKDVMSLFEPKLDRKGIRYELVVNGQIRGYVVSDTAKFRQILINLIGNAVKFTTEGSITVEVNVTEAEADFVDLEVTVADTGIGIPQENHEKVFEPFTQLDDNSDRRYEGTGLGLPISRKLCDVLSATLSLTSEPGIGSRFSIKLNHVEVQGKPENLVTYENTSDAPLYGRTILVADDLKENRNLIKLLLSKYNGKILEAASGEEAIQMLESEDPEIILMDLSMPGMGGTKAAEIIKETTQGSIPILVTTAALNENWEADQGNLFDGVIRKPLRRVEFIQKLLRLLNKIDSKKRTTDPGVEINQSAPPDYAEIRPAKDTVSDLIIDQFASIYNTDILNMQNTMILDDLLTFKNNIDEFAHTHQLPVLKELAEALGEYVADLEFEKINQILELLLTEYGTKE